MPKKVRIAFMGTNGWYPTKTGNTVSALVETPERYIVLDAGDGLFGLDSFAPDNNRPVDLYLSHFHLDHVWGLHALPKMRFAAGITIWGQPGTKKALSLLLDHPFTTSLSEIRTRVSVREIGEGRHRIAEGCIVEAAPLVHADPCFGYRFELGMGKDMKAVAYCTDTGPCKNVARLGRNADALIMECGLLPGSPISPGWPHLTPEAAAKMARESGCRRLYLTHFAAHLYTDMRKRKMAETAAKKIFPRTTAARDGLEIRI